MGLKSTEQPNLGPLRTYLMPLGPGAKFQLSPGQLVPAWATPQECQSQVLSLALSSAVIYCTPWMNPIPGSSPQLVWWLFTAHRTCHCHQHDLALMLWDCTFSVRSPASGLYFAPSSSSLWKEHPALTTPAILMMPKALLNEIISMKCQTLEKKKMLVLPIQEEMKLHI